MLNQWVDELNHFLEIREEPPEYETKTEGSTVYIVEGNSSNAVNRRNYNINNGTIMGYGLISV